MDQKTKVELVKAAVPGVVIPVLKAGVNHHFTMKQMSRNEEVALKMAEMEAEKHRELARAAYGGGRRDGQLAAAGGASVGRDEPVGRSNADVYDDLEAIKASTDCRFCHTVADSLMEASPSEARRGADELRSYLREVERIEGHGISEEEAEEVITDLVDRWEVIPQHAAGMA